MVSPTLKHAAELATAIPTMVEVGAVLEDHVADVDEYIDAAILLGGIRGAKAVKDKLMRTYRETGVQPRDILKDIQQDPTILPDLLSDNKEIPTTYRPQPEPPKAEPPTVEPPTAEPPKAGSLQAAQKEILSRVVQTETKKPWPTLSELYTQYIDNLNPIKQAEREASPTGKEAVAGPYMLERLTRGIFGKGQQFINFGPFDADTYEKVGKSYTEAMKPVENELDAFRAFMVSKRAIELEGQGVITGVNVDAAKTVVKESPKKYETVFRERLAYRDALVNYLQQSGVLSTKTVEAMREMHKDYVPFFRFFEDRERASTSTKVFNPIKALKGSERPIIDPFESDIKDTFLLLSLAEKNFARQAFVALGPKFAEKIDTPVRPIKLTEQEIKRIGGTTEGITEEIATIFRSFTDPLKKDETVVYHEGKRSVYRVNPGVAEAFNASDRTSANFLMNMLNTPAVLLRAGTVLNPDFFMRNFMRDAVSSFVYAGSNPIKTLKGAKSLIMKDEVYQKWLAGGGANATLVAIDRNYIQAELFKLNRETGIMEKAWNVAKLPVEMLQMASELVENATRLGAAYTPLKQAKTKAAIQAAAFLSREATVDFSRHGADPVFREYTKMAAFMNPGIQGIDRLFRALHDDPLGVTAKGFAAVTIPSLLLWWANHDDPRWPRIPQWERDLYHIVMTENTIYRIPKSFELGIMFGTVPERLLEAFLTDHPEALKDLDKTLISAFGVNTIPTWTAPIIEQFANRSLFTGNPLIPADREGLLPEYQYTPYTTEAAKALGAIIGAFPGMGDRARHDEDTFIGGTARALTTPILIENYLRSWTGGLGLYTLQLADKMLRETHVLPDPVKPTAALSDVPFIRAFVVRYPSATAQPIQNFYDTYYAKKQVYDTFIKLSKEGDMNAALKVRTIDKSAWNEMAQIREALTQQSQIIHLINKNPTLTATDKRQLIDTLYFRMIELSEFGNKTMADLDRFMKP